MELDEMKGLWENMSQELERQRLLTDKMVVEMTRNKYKNQLRGISWPEMAGTAICFAIASYVIVNFDQLDTWYLALCGVVSICFCLILPILSMRSIWRMKKIDLSNNSYKETLEHYAREKDTFMKVQKAGFYLGFIFALCFLPVAGKLMNGKDLLLDGKLWTWGLPILLVFHFLFSKWVWKHYSSVTRNARNLLDELKDES
jgi:UDP-N-acetylmuramyl pentapeptide phosphotransferase/UDP-N-acetylglucosamine-1-phosphate transferase